MHYVKVAPGKIVREGVDYLTYHHDEPLAIGSVVDLTHGRTSSSGIVIGLVNKPKFKTKAISQVRAEQLPSQLVRTLVWMSEYYATPLPLVVNNCLPSGLGVTRRKAAEPTPPVSRPMSDFKLSAGQLQAVKAIDQSKSTVILHGDTGAGKTLVYRDVIKSVLSQGKSAIVLVPEIGLTPQAAGDYQDLSPNLFVTHSGLSQSQRHQLWQKIATANEPVVVIGPRSALLMPVHNLGLVVLDEAHESSYKQDVSPRYQSQTVAAHLAGEHSAKLILGSATPRVTDVYLARQRKLPVLTLPRFSPSQPVVEVVDKSQKDNFSRNRYLSNKLIEQIEQALSAGKQSMIYLNRRGTATVGLCTNCGWSALCPRCNSQLTLHKDLNQLRCHVCSWHGKIPSACPECGQPEIAYKGIGTKRLEEEVRRLWPTASVARFDTDNLKGRRLVDLYAELHEGKIDITVGTQVIARGLDLPNLQVVGVVSADSELYLPDFSASERTFQLIYQVIGRAGRLGGGQVVVQAWQPKHPAIKLAVESNYDQFYDYEISVRDKHHYPPFSHLMALVGSYATREKTQDAAIKAQQILKTQFNLSSIGPAPAFYEKRGSKYRWMLVVKSKKRQQLLAAASKFRLDGWQIDLDPINLLY